MTTSAEKNAQAQVLFREVNEHIAQMNSQWQKTGLGVFICECSNTACSESVSITPDEYERIRGDGAQFVVLPGHQLPEIERVVGGNGRYRIVEKLGEAATVARASNPRDDE